jgi:hypothetical protein
MELIYSTQTGDFEDGKRYRHPQYFRKPEAGATKVTVVGDWPEVVAAYKAADVPVTQVAGATKGKGRAKAAQSGQTGGDKTKADGGKAGSANKGPDKPIEDLSADELQEQLKAKGIEYPADADEAALRELLKANQA